MPDQSMELYEFSEDMHEQLTEPDIDTVHHRMFNVTQKASTHSERYPARE
jgi:hypothetical protein